jgi:uncharacterized protein (TIGR00251 family)
LSYLPALTIADTLNWSQNSDSGTVELERVPLFAWDTVHGARIRIRVQPRASRSGIIGRLGDALKVSLMAVPVDGQANEALVALLAEQLHVRPSAIRVVGGLRSRTKVLEITGVSAAVLMTLGGLYGPEVR